MTDLTVTEAAERLRVSRRTMERWIAEGRLPVLDYGPRTRRIDERALEDYRLRQRRRVA